MGYAATPSRGRARARLHLVDDHRYADWEAVYRDNVERLYALMYSRVGNRPDAEDLTAEVFRSALGPLQLGLSKGEVRAYLLSAARTVLASHWRKRLGQPVTFIDPVEDLHRLTEPPAAEPAVDRSDEVECILSALPERYRRILELRFIDAASVKDAARALDVSVANAKVLQHRALAMATRVAAEMEAEP
jgi:RNA polymerase sigma-70 factor (ECF subfamily)